MKKVLTLFLAFCMLLSVIPMAISAETINPTPDSSAKTTPAYAGVQNTALDVAKTVYVSNTGDDTNGDGSKTSPVKDIQVASELLGVDGGEIVVLDDIEVKFSASRQLLADSTTSPKTRPNGPIYLHGVKQDDNSYSKITFNKSSAQYLRLYCTTVIYDIEISKTGGELWITSSSYELTIGNNVTTSLGDDTSTINICGGQKESAHGDIPNPAPEAITNIYSGTWNTVSAVSWNPGGSTPQRAGTLNVYGGTIATLYTKRSHGNLKPITNITVNYYAGEIKTITGIYVDGDAATHTLNLYNSTSATLEGVFAEGGIGVINENVAGTAPAFQPLSYSVRFVAVLADSYTNYSEIGFTLKANGKDYSSECKKVYTSIAGNGTDPYTAEELGGQYIFALALKDIPTSAGTVTFEVTPYVVDSTGTHNGATYTVVYNAGAFVSSSAN